MASLVIEVQTKLYTARGHAKVMRHVLRSRMEFWKSQLLPTHFQLNELTRPGGAYGYETRSVKWQKKKAAAKGHQKPLVYRGNLQASVMANSTITATQHKATFRAKSYFPLTPQRRREIEVVTNGQQRLLVSGAMDLYVRAAGEPEFQDLKRIRIRG